jgi:hypothetical protein
VRSKIWFSFKIGAINAKKALKMAAEMATVFYKNIKVRFILTKSGKNQAKLSLVA